MEAVDSDESTAFLLPPRKVQATLMSSHPPERSEILQLVRMLGHARGTLAATSRQIEEIREYFGRHVLRAYVDAYVMGKFNQHVEIDGHWPEDTTPEEYLESLRETVLDTRGSIYLTNAGPKNEWTI